MNPVNEPVTPMSYLGEIAASSYGHGGALSLTLICAMAIGTAACLLFPAHAIAIIPVVIAAAIVFELARAAWRLHRRQNIALATLRLLLDLDTADRALFERHLQETHRWREERLHERNADRVEKLFDEIKSLQSEVDTLAEKKGGWRERSSK